VAGTEFLRFLNDLLWIARSEYFGIAVALILVGWAVFSSIKMKQGSERSVRETAKLGRAISDVDGPLAFTASYAEIDETIKAEARFRGTWIEFSKTLIPPLDHIDSPEFRVYRATKRPGDYFDNEHVLKDVRPVILESDNLIGLGLLFTFLGLIAALLHAGLNLGSESSEGVQRVIQDLLSTAGAKFFASLGGVLGALIQTVAQRRFSEQSETALDEFIFKLETLLPFASAEKIAAEQYAHAIRQTARLEEMGTEITLALGNRIENALAGMPDMLKTAMSSAMTPTNERLDRLADGISTTSTDAMSELVAQFTQQLTGAGEKTMNQVVIQLDSLSTTLNQTVGSLATSNIEIRQTMSELLTAMKSGGAQFGESVKTSADAATQQISEVMQNVSGTLGAISNRLDQQQSEISSAITSLVQTFGQAGSDAADSLRANSERTSSDISDALQASIQSVLNSASSAGEQMAQRVAAGVDSAGQEMSQKAQQALEATATAIDEVMSRVSNALEGWRASTLETNNAMGRINQALSLHNQTLDGLNVKLADTSVAVSGTAQTLRDSAAPLTLASTQLSASTEALKRTISEAMVRLDEAGAITNKSAAEISSSITALTEAWEKQASHLDRTDEQIEKAFLSVVANLEQSLGILSKFAQSLNDSLGSSIRDLGTIASELVDAVEGMKK
jgi:predicted  nucleic acid-binding Zn-ribbon protein